MSNDEEQKRHISRVISAIRDDDVPDPESPRRKELEEGKAAHAAEEPADDEYYVDEEERRQWDYDEAGSATSTVDEEQLARRSRRDAGRPAGWGLLLDWRLVTALAILVAGLYMVNFSGDDNAEVQEASITPAVAGGEVAAQGEVASAFEVDEIARLEARIAALEQRLAAVGTNGSENDGALAAPVNTVTKDEMQVLRDQVNAGLKAQQDVTRAAVRDLEQRLTRTIDTKVAAVSRPTQASTQTPTQTRSQSSADGSPSAANGSWFVNVATYSQRTTADAMIKRLQDSGHTAAIVPATIGGEPSFRVRVTDLSSRESAQEIARELEAQLGVRGLWVGES